MVGAFDHAATASQYRNIEDDNHIYLWLRISFGPDVHLYECAVNVASTHPDRTLPPILYCAREEVIPHDSLPADGFHADVSCSYEELGLRDAHFGPLPQEPFGPSILALAKSCHRLAAYGVTYGNGEGLHDIHLNSHEAATSLHRDRLDANRRPTQDGALVFYFPAKDEMFRACWIFSKFPTQQLG